MADENETIYSFGVSGVSEVISALGRLSVAFATMGAQVESTLGDEIPGGIAGFVKQISKLEEVAKKLKDVGFIPKEFKTGLFPAKELEEEQKALEKLRKEYERFWQRADLSHPNPRNPIQAFATRIHGQTNTARAGVGWAIPGMNPTGTESLNEYYRDIETQQEARAAERRDRLEQEDRLWGQIESLQERLRDVLGGRFNYDMIAGLSPEQKRDRLQELVDRYARPQDDGWAFGPGNMSPSQIAAAQHQAQSNSLKGWFSQIAGRGGVSGIANAAAGAGFIPMQLASFLIIGQALFKVGKLVLDFGKKVKEATDEIAKIGFMSAYAGASTAQTQVLGAAFEPFGGDNSGAAKWLRGARGDLQRLRMGQAGGRLQEAAVRYGLDITGNTMGGLVAPEKLLFRIADWFGRIDNKDMRTDMANILGLDESTFMLVKDGLKAMKEQMEARVSSSSFVYNNGAVFSETAIKTSQQLKKSWADLWNSLKEAGGYIAEVLVPIINLLVAAFTTLMRGLNILFGWIFKAVGWLMQGVDWIADGILEATSMKGTETIANTTYNDNHPYTVNINGDINTGGSGLYEVLKARNVSPVISYNNNHMGGMLA